MAIVEIRVESGRASGCLLCLKEVSMVASLVGLVLVSSDDDVSVPAPVGGGLAIIVVVVLSSSPPPAQTIWR